MRDNKNHAPETLERSLDSTLESVDSAEELTLSVAQRAGFDEDDLMKIGMAVRESMVNAVVHGNRYSAHKKVRLLVTHSPERFTIRIADEGEGYDPANIPDPLAPENLMRTSGEAFSSSGRLWMSLKCATGNPGYGSNFGQIRGV